MRLQLNGETREVSARDIEGLIAELGLPPAACVVLDGS